MLVLLRRLLVLCAGLLVTLFAALWFVEESGLVLRFARGALLRTLGPLGERVTIEELDLCWFRPGIELAGVQLEPLAGASAVRLERVRVTFSPDLERVLTVEIEGGKVRLGEGLFSDWDRFQATRPAGATDGATPALARVAVRGLALELELPDGSALELGELSLTGRPGAAEAYELAGGLAPSLGGALTATEPIRVSGSVTSAGARAWAAARDLDLRSGAHPALTRLLPFALAQCAARLTLDGFFELSFAQAARPRGALHAALAQGEIALAPGLPALTGLALELDATLEPPAGEGLWSRTAWDARARLDGQLGASPLWAWLTLGRSVRDGGWLEAWAGARRVSLEPAALASLGLEAHFAFVRQMLDPRGEVDLALDLLADGVPGATLSGSSVLLARASAGLELAYLGFPGDPASGVPLRVRTTGGEFLAGARPLHARPWRLLAHELTADHGSGSVSGWTQVGAPPRERPLALPDFDLLLSSPSIALDEPLADALAKNRHLAWLVPAFAPKGGALTGSWRMHGAPELAAMQAEGEFRFGGTSLRWADVPVPLEGVQGEVLVRFGDEVGHSATQPSYPRRPFGVTYRIDNRKESKSGARARISGWVREEHMPAVFDASVPAETLQELSIDIDELGLRGQAFDLLAQRFPALRREAESYGAVGRVHVAFRGSQPRAGVPFVSEIEATPLAVHVTPQIFQRQTKEVTGRLLVRTADVPGGEESSAQLALTGQWPGGAELFAHGNVPASGPATIEVLGAGIDPTNTSFKGALSTSLNAANPTAGIDLSAWTLAGPVDFALAASFEPESPAPAENRYTIQLRDNDLHARDLVLADLQGTFHQEGVVLSSPLVRATLGGHPLELAQVETFPLGAAAGFAGADPWLAREGFWTDANGRALQAFVTTRDLPLDAEHLTGLLTPEALENLRANESWHGQIDVLGARLLVTSEFENDGKVAVRGPMQLEELGLRLGIPLRVARARVDLKELVQEEGRFRGWAEISAIDASLAERALTDAHLIASYVDGRLTIDDLAGDFEGGRLESLGGGGDLASKALGIDLAEPHRFDVGLRLTDVSVGGLLRGVFQSSIADEGVLDATLQLSGTPDDILGLTGRGSLSLDEGALWSIPVMRELFGQLGFDRAGLFDRLRARFELRDGRIQISHVELQSSLLDLVGAGWQDLDGELAYDLEVRYGLLDRLGVIGRALYWFNNNLMRVAVRGDFDRPTVSIRNSLVELLRRFDERPARLLPLPPFSTLGERF